MKDKSKSYSSDFFRTPRKEQNSNATGEGVSIDVKGSCDDGILPECRYWKQICRDSSKKKKWKRKQKQNTIRIGTWNVQTMLEMGKLNLLVKELERSQMNITGLVEVRWRGEGKFSHGDHTIVYSGNEKGGQNGVAIVLDKKHAAAMKSFNTISDRILSLKLNTKHHTLNIIQVYAPTTTSSDEEIEQFYNDLQTTKDKVPRREACIVMGDLNAKVGEGEDRVCGIGPYGLGERNERGDMLASFCQANELDIANTLFRQPVRRRYTWISPGDRVRNQIDYIMIDRRWKSSVLNSKTLPGTDCDTDHILVTAKIRFKAMKVSKKKPSPKFDTEKLENPDIASSFQIELSNRFTQLMEVWTESDKLPEELWNDMKKVYIDTAEEKLGRKRRTKPKSYLSDEVMELAKEKSNARKSGKREEYLRLKREIKSKIRRDKKDWLEQECAKINEHNEKGKARELFQQIRSVKHNKFQAKNQCINAQDGTTLTEPEDILKRWQEYGQTLFSGQEKTNTKNTERANITELEPEPLYSEVEAATKELKCRKSPGLDNIPSELLKNSGEGGLKAMHYLCCKIWKTSQWPTDWKTQEFVMLHKSGEVKDCNNYRTIALICHASKILLIIILKRLKQKVEFELSDCQAGYRSNRGTADMLFVLQNIIEKVKGTNEELFITFIDYSKAFDSVIHQHLFETMRKMGFPKHIISLISSLYENQRGTIRWDNQKCEFFNISKGVRQGCILSPHLFNIYTEQVMRESNIEDMGPRIGGRNITNLRYADDTALLADNITSMKRVLYRVDEAGKRAGLKLNAKKTKVMYVTGDSCQVEHEINIDKTPLENVKDFKYLGSVKANDGSCTKDIKTRIGMAKGRMIQLNNIWKDHSIPLDLKTKILKCLVWPVMLYGCESWTQRKEDDRKIEAAEMWFLRRLLRVSWTDRRTNESVLYELATTRELLSTVYSRKLRYAGHAMRNQMTDLMKTIFQGKIEAKRKRGRPPTSLIGNITGACNMKIHEIGRACQDRNRWRRITLSASLNAAANIANGDADR